MRTREEVEKRLNFSLGELEKARKNFGTILQKGDLENELLELYRLEIEIKLLEWYLEEPEEGQSTLC